MNQNAKNSCTTVYYLNMKFSLSSANKLKIEKSREHHQIIFFFYKEIIKPLKNFCESFKNPFLSKTKKLKYIFLINKISSIILNDIVLFYIIYWFL